MGSEPTKSPTPLYSGDDINLLRTDGSLPQPINEPNSIRRPLRLEDWTALTGVLNETDRRFEDRPILGETGEIKRIQASYTISDDRSNSSQHTTDLLVALQPQTRKAVMTTPDNQSSYQEDLSQQKRNAQVQAKAIAMQQQSQMAQQRQLQLQQQQHQYQQQQHFIEQSLARQAALQAQQRQVVPAAQQLQPRMSQQLPQVSHAHAEQQQLHRVVQQRREGNWQQDNTLKLPVSSSPIGALPNNHDLSWRPSDTQTLSHSLHQSQVVSAAQNAQEAKVTPWFSAPSTSPLQHITSLITDPLQSPPVSVREQPDNQMRPVSDKHKDIKRLLNIGQDNHNLLSEGAPPEHLGEKTTVRQANALESREIQPSMSTSSERPTCHYAKGTQGLKRDRLNPVGSVRFIGSQAPVDRRPINGQESNPLTPEPSGPPTISGQNGFVERDSHNSSDSISSTTSFEPGRPAPYDSGEDMNAKLAQPMELMKPETPKHKQDRDALVSGVCTGDFQSLSNQAQLQDYVHDLESKLRILQAENRVLLARIPPGLPSRWQTLYRIPDQSEDVYMDYPRCLTDGEGSRILQCSIPLSNFDLYLERNKDIAFVVFKDFHAGDSHRPQKHDSLSNHGGTTTVPIEPFQESIMPVSQDLIAAIKHLLASNPTFSDFAIDFEDHAEILSPYLCIYHSRDSYDEVVQGMSHTSVRHFDLLKQYVGQRFGDEYSRADDLMSRGIIHRELIKYLFQPDQLVLSNLDGSEKAYMVTSWALSASKNASAMDLRRSPVDNELSGELVCQINGWSWSFDGSFSKEMTKLVSKIPKSAPEELRITDLNIYPLKFAAQQTISRLEERGKILWSCRFRRFVSYERESSCTNIQDVGEERYMVDVETFKKLHPASAPAGGRRDDLGVDAMTSQDLPDRNFLMLLPPKVKGFNIREKKWHDLEVGRIRGVPWNTKAFESLVLPEKTKKIIRALVTKQLALEKSTDLIKGKGNGLIILLHGGPGTGKTLTAESIAEIVQKPLYRVTCGDVGTKPEDVEKYMESVLYLGKLWDCVVLLDEADVFLQERNLQDLQRNALVSVFLRVLEYHEGILFLTSNRIGTFDEAFKSRIQLSLHYKPLGLPERKKVWRNFIKHVEDLGEENVDYEDLRDNVDILAEKALNGRQIRNAITIARQLAQYDSEKLNHEHLKDVITIAADFDNYVKGLNEDMSDEDRMRELQIR